MEKEVYLYLFTLPDKKKKFVYIYLHFTIERENISYLLMLPCRLENISFSLFFDGLSHFLTKKSSLSIRR